MTLSHDILLDDTDFNTASSEMTALKIRTEAFEKKLEEMYKELPTALDTPVGKQVQVTAGKVLIKPIEDLLIVHKANVRANGGNYVRFNDGSLLEMPDDLITRIVRRD